MFVVTSIEVKQSIKNQFDYQFIKTLK